MKLLGLIASLGLAIAPMSAIADDANTTVKDANVAVAAPAPGGVAASSFDIDEDDSELLVVGLVAGTALIAVGTILAISNGGDDNPTVVTATGTN